MKHIEKYNAGKEVKNTSYCYVEDKIFVTTDGVVGYIFNEVDFYIDKSKMNKVDGMKQVIDCDMSKQEPVEPAGCTQKIDKRVAVELENKNFKVYLDEKLIERFGYVEDLTYYGKSSKSPVYVFEGEQLVGLIMPMRVN